MSHSFIGQRLPIISKRSLLVPLGLLGGAAALLVSGANLEDKAPAPVLSMREFELKPGADAAEFEKFVRGEMCETVAKSVKGMKIKILKGDRGERKGAYILVWEFDSVAARNQFFPREGGMGGPPLTRPGNISKPSWASSRTTPRRRAVTRITFSCPIEPI